MLQSNVKQSWNGMGLIVTTDSSRYSTFYIVYVSMTFLIAVDATLSNQTFVCNCLNNLYLHLLIYSVSVKKITVGKAFHNYHCLIKRQMGTNTALRFGCAEGKIFKWSLKHQQIAVSWNTVLHCCNNGSVIASVIHVCLHVKGRK